MTFYEFIAVIGVLMRGEIGENRRPVNAGSALRRGFSTPC
jgi:hypothetical protein